MLDYTDYLKLSFSFMVFVVTEAWKQPILPFLDHGSRAEAIPGLRVKLWPCIKPDHSQLRLLP
jgi:hypothetical protein